METMAKAANEEQAAKRQQYSAVYKLKVLKEANALHEARRAFVLGAAGVLAGLEATTHWLAFERLVELGARPAARRVVVQGKVITAAGVSAGIDMALLLAARIAGEEFARAIQLGIEYDPEPPFDSGSPAKAHPETVARLRSLTATSAARSPG